MKRPVTKIDFLLEKHRWKEIDTRESVTCPNGERVGVCAPNTGRDPEAVRRIPSHLEQGIYDVFLLNNKKILIKQHAILLKTHPCEIK